MRKTFVQVNGILYEKGTEPTSDAPMVMPDIKPYRSMIDGSLITSRSRHREHLKAHGYQEVGNDSSLNRVPSIPEVNPEGRKELIRAQVSQMRHSEFKRALQRDLDRIRWNSRKD